MIIPLTWVIQFLGQIAGSLPIALLMCVGGLTKATKEAIIRQMAYTAVRDQDIVQTFQKVLDA